MTRRELLLTSTALGTARLSATPSEPHNYPNREDLLQVWDSDAVLVPVRDPRAWGRRRSHILENMERVMGPFPGPEFRVPLEIEVLEDRVEAGIRRIKLSYQSAPAQRVPARLLIPVDAQAGRTPAVLALHQTVAIGKDEPCGLGGSSQLHYGIEAAQRGYVVLAPDYPTLGEHQVDVYRHGWASCSMRAIWDNVRGLDLLSDRPEVDSTRIGCLGHSLGGHNTLFTAVFDRRVRALVSNCGFTAFGRYYGGRIAGWSGDRYMPRIRTEFTTPEKMPWDFHEVVAALAPRPFLAIAPERDDNFDLTGVREVIAAARPVYRLLGHPERLAARHPDCAHAWPDSERAAAYAWLDRWLR